MKKFSFSFSDLPFVFRESLRGKSLARIFLNLALKKTKPAALHGRILDLGSKTDCASYYRFLPRADDSELICTDLYAESDNVKKVDLEKPFPKDLGQFNAILCFNTLEHISNTDNLLGQSSAYLTPGGRFLGSAPFLYPYHKDPDDFYRFTHSALAEFFTQHGLTPKHITPIGHGPFTLGFNFVPGPGIFRAFFQTTLFALDLILKPYTRRYPDAFTLIYVFEAVK
ncbi:MAG: methyltransferase domain-containing protein [Patescibacteria group bacterium]